MLIKLTSSSKRIVEQGPSENKTKYNIYKLNRSRTKRTALLQRFKMASRIAADWLQKGWLQQSQILAARSSALKPFGSDKQRFSSGGKNSQKRC